MQTTKNSDFMTSFLEFQGLLVDDEFGSPYKEGRVIVTTEKNFTGHNQWTNWISWVSRRMRIVLDSQRILRCCGRWLQGHLIEDSSALTA
jgi:hypothetical protein